MKLANAKTKQKRGPSKRTRRGGTSKYRQTQKKFATFSARSAWLSFRVGRGEKGFFVDDGGMEACHAMNKDDEEEEERRMKKGRENRIFLCGWSWGKANKKKNKQAKRVYVMK